MRQYRQVRTAAFKVESVRLMKERLAMGLTLQRVSDELDIGPDLLRSWAKSVAGAPSGATPDEIFPGGGRRRGFAPAESLPPRAETESVEAQLRRLQRENERLRQERDFLKKAAAFFAKESR